MIRSSLLVAILLCATAARSDGLRGADLALPDHPVDMNVRQIRASRLFEALAGIAERDVLVDPCVDEKKIDIKLVNAPLPLIFDALASQARLEYRLEGNSIRVRCSGTAAPAPSADARPYNVRVRADLREALERSFPGASTDEIDRAIATLEAQLRHD
jgi:hypothetical protein